MSEMQSAYHNHSTKTALVGVLNDLAVASDSGFVTAACAIDLTAAFDTVGNDILLLRHE